MGQTGARTLAPRGDSNPDATHDRHRNPARPRPAVGAAARSGHAAARPRARAGDHGRRADGARPRRLPRLPRRQHDLRGVRRLRRPRRGLGRGHWDGHGVRGGRPLPRGALAPPSPDDGPDRADAGRAHQRRRLDRPAAAGRARRAAAHHGGRPDGLSPSGTGPARRPRHRDGRGRNAGCRGRGGQHHRRAPAQARPVRVLEAARGLGGGARRAVAEPGQEPRAGVDHPCPTPRRPLPPGGREPGVSWLDGGRDPPRHERAGVVGGDDGGAGTRRPGAARPRRRRPGRRPLPAADARGGPRRGQGRGPRRGRAEGHAGQRALLCRLAARRFDAGTAEGLAELLADVDDPVDLADVGDWIIDCATGNDLLARCSSLRGWHPPTAD